MSLIGLLAFTATIVVNALANSLPINGMTTGEISDRYPNLFVPAGFTFSIWGVIYLLLAVYIVYQLAVAFRERPSSNSFIRKTLPLFLLASLANMAWIFAWHHTLIMLSLLMMMVLLASLLILYLKLGIGIGEASKAERYFVHLPFSVYLGWITVATIANITAWLISIHWNGWGLSPFFWTTLMILAAGIIGLLMLLYRKDLYFCLVIIWAITGIIVKRASAGGQTDDAIAIVAAFVAGILIINLIIQLIRKRVW